MECSSCGSQTSINFGDASMVLCQSCDYAKKSGKEVKPEESSRSSMDPTDSYSVLSNYSTAIGVSKFLGYCGWFTVVVGVIVAFAGLSQVSRYANGIQQLFALGPGVGVAISGLFMVAAAQVTRAVVDTADNSRKMLSIMEATISSQSKN